MEPAIITHLLDTHAWVWFFNDDPRAGKLVERLPAEAILGVSTISIWEAAMLEAKGRISFLPELGVRVREMTTRGLCELVPLLPEIAIASTRLENFHNDPSDRIIVATSRHIGATLVTADGKIIRWAEGVGKLPVLTL